MKKAAVPAFGIESCECFWPKTTSLGSGLRCCSAGSTPASVSSAARMAESILRRRKIMSAPIHYLASCKVCRTPIRGFRSWPNRLKGIQPFYKNPQLCNR